MFGSAMWVAVTMASIGAAAVTVSIVGDTLIAVYLYLTGP